MFCQSCLHLAENYDSQISWKFPFPPSRKNDKIHPFFHEFSPINNSYSKYELWKWNTNDMIMNSQKPEIFSITSTNVAVSVRLGL
jgi:hypothetical protein